MAIEVDGKLAFVVRKNGKEFVVFGGKELKKYDSAGWLKNVNGKLSYTATDRTNWDKNNWEGESAEIFDGEVLTYNGKGTDVGNIVEANGKLAYTRVFMDKSCINNNCWALVVDDTPGESYDYIKSETLRSEGGKVIFTARRIGEPATNWIDVVDERLLY